MEKNKGTRKLFIDDLLGYLSQIDKQCFKDTGKSINHLPEYYLGVKLTDQLVKSGHYSFDLEFPANELLSDVELTDLKFKKSVKELVSQLNFNAKPDDLAKRIKNGRIDMVVRTKQRKSIRHLVEIKKGSNIQKLQNDIARLAWFSNNSAKKSLKTSFLIFSTVLKKSTVREKLDSLKSKEVKISTEQYISDVLSTRKNTNGKEVSLWIVEIKIS